MELSERQQHVLRAIVRDYIESCEPVGSRTISRKYDLGVSAATIRNEMADLEAEGFLEQPHTSAGRVPSDRGYRFYVDRLMQAGSLTPQEVKQIRSAYQDKATALETVVKRTAMILSEMTRCIAVVMGPRVEDSTLRYLQILPLREDTGLLVLVTSDGLIEHKKINLPSGMPAAEIRHFSQVLSKRLAGRELAAIGRSVLNELQVELSSYKLLLDDVLNLLYEEQQDQGEERLFFGGTTNLLEQPEFRDVERAKVVLGALEQQQLVADLIGGRRESGIGISIGGEIKYEAVQDCSIITATYQVGGQTLGHLGIVGPKRMPYSHLVTLVDQISRRLNDTLTRW